MNNLVKRNNKLVLRRGMDYCIKQYKPVTNVRIRLNSLRKAKVLVMRFDGNKLLDLRVIKRIKA